MQHVLFDRPGPLDDVVLFAGRERKLRIVKQLRGDLLADAPRIGELQPHARPIGRRRFLTDVGMGVTGMALQGLLAYQGKLRFIISEKGQTRFALSEPPTFVPEDEAVAELLMAYLRTYGPAMSVDRSSTRTPSSTVRT